MWSLSVRMYCSPFTPLYSPEYSFFIIASYRIKYSIDKKAFAPQKKDKIKKMESYFLFAKVLAATELIHTNQSRFLLLDSAGSFFFIYI